MILKHALVYNEDFCPVPLDIELKGRTIQRLAPHLEGEEEYDLSGLTVVPGFVDIHIHGCMGADTCDADPQALAKMAGHLVRKGVTSFCPTTMTVSWEQLKKSLEAVKLCMQVPPEGASICGVNMEGPYISAKKRGAQKEEYVQVPDWDAFHAFYECFQGIIKLVDIAPECKNADVFIQNASKLFTVSLAHSEADYEQAKRAFQLGISQVTHLYNAMTGFSHRAPGVVGAVFDDDKVFAELICDGFHVHPAVLRTTFKVLGENRTIVVSDSMRAAGLPDGVSELGGQTVYVKQGKARLQDGTIAGSTTNLHEEVKNLISYGIPARQVIRSVTINPAKQIGLADKIGSITVGKQADLVVLDKNYDIKLVIVKGNVLVNHMAEDSAGSNCL